MLMSVSHLNLSSKIYSYLPFDNISNQIFWCMQRWNGYGKTKAMFFCYFLNFNIINLTWLCSS